ncbi:MAG: hypothetical protein AAB527_00200 [Patescibacteria group bacterium]
MNNLNILVLFTSISLGMAFVFFFFPGVIAPIPYGVFTFFLAFIITLWVGIRLGRQRVFASDEVRSLINTLRIYFLTMSAFFFFDGIAHVGIPALYPVEILASHTHTFSHVFFFVANAILIRIPVAFFSSRLKNPASALVLILGALAVVWRVINTDKLIYIFGQNQPPIVITDKISGLLFLANNVIALLLPGFYMMYLGIKSKEREVKVKAFLLGLGMAVFFTVGPVIDILQSQYTQLLVHALLALSFFFMGAAAFYGEKESDVARI